MLRRVLIDAGDSIPLLVPQIVQGRNILVLCHLVHNGIHDVPPRLRQIAVHLFAFVMLHLFGEL